jgi:hypothetical protein
MTFYPTLMDNLENETLLVYYDSARQEMMSRVSLRENSMMLYFGAVGALIAGAIQANQPMFLMIIPYLSLGISLIMLHHNAIIGALILYCTQELESTIKSKGVSVVQWDNSISRLVSSRSTRHYRFWGDIVLIMGPSFFSIIYNWDYFGSDMKKLVIISFSVLCSVVAIIFLWKALNIRNTTFAAIGAAPAGKKEKARVAEVSA